MLILSKSSTSIRVFLAAAAMLSAALPVSGADLRVIVEFDGPPALLAQRHSGNSGSFRVSAKSSDSFQPGPFLPAADGSGAVSPDGRSSSGGAEDPVGAARDSIVRTQADFLRAAGGIVKPLPGRSGSPKVSASSMNSDDPAATISSSGCRSMTDVFNGMAAVVPEEEIPRIRGMAGVKAVHPDKVVRFSLAESVPIINADEAWTITDAAGAAIRGKGVKVAILDTGIDYTHPDLGGGFGASFKVIGGYDFVNYDFDPRDDNGHGTHVAGIIAASGQMTGVAPGASLMAYKVLDSSGSGYSSDVVSAIGKAVSDGADIINISLGTMDDTPLTTAAENAVSAGVIVCAAAGNEGPTIRTINSPGDGPNVISVAACEKSLAIWYGSSRGPTSTGLSKPDITAPGKSIRSTYRGSTYAYLTGTSMACPHVTGVCALILQAGPSLDPAGVRKRLYDNAVNLGYPHTTQGYGLVDARAAVLNGKAAQPPTLAVTSPATAGETVDLLAFINWIDSDPDSSASISLHYDIDAAGFDGTAITSGISEDSSENQYIWNTAAVPEGWYYIYGVISDGVNPAVKTYAPGSFRVSHPPDITLKTPSSAGVVAFGSCTVSWTDQDSDDNATIRFFADSDRGGYDGTQLPGTFSEDPEGTGDTADLDISSLGSGVYYLYASASDGHSPVAYSYAAGPMVVNSPPALDFVSPPEGTEIFARSGRVEFSFVFQDRDDAATAILFVDSDGTGFDGVQISDALAESMEPLKLTWDLSDLPPGDYWIYSEASDGVNQTVKAYAPWTVLRNDPPQAAFFAPSAEVTVASVSLGVSYSLVDGDSVATASIFAFPEGRSAERTRIAGPSLAETARGEFSWDVTGVASGRYGIVMVSSDGLNDPVETMCAAIVEVNHLPAVIFDGGAGADLAMVVGATFEVTVMAVDDENPSPGVSLFWDSDAAGVDGTPLVPVAGSPSVYAADGMAPDRFRVYAVADDGVNPPVSSYSPVTFFKTRVGSISEVRLANLASDRALLVFRAAASANPVVEFRVIGTSPEAAPGANDSAAIRTQHASSTIPGVFEAELSSLTPSSTIGARIVISSDGVEHCFPATGELVFNTPDIEMHSISAYFRATVENSLGVKVFIDFPGSQDLPASFSSVVGTADSNGDIAIPVGPFFDGSGGRFTPDPGDIVRATVTSADRTLSRVVDFPMPELGSDADLGVISLFEAEFQVITLSGGWNIASLTVHPEPALTAGGFLEITRALMVASWDSASQSYRAVFRGDSGFVGTDFPLLPGNGFFVKAPQSVTVQISGKRPEKPLVMPIAKGFNLFGSARPSGPLGGGAASILLGVEPGNVAAYSWNARSQTYGLIYKSVDSLGQISIVGTDFPLSPGGGFFVKAMSPGFYLDE